MAHVNGTTTRLEDDFSAAQQQAAIEEQARAEARSEALAMLETCALGGLTAKAALRLIKPGATVASVRAAILVGNQMAKAVSDITGEDL